MVPRTFASREASLCKPGIHFFWKQPANLCGSTNQSLEMVILVCPSWCEAEQGPAEPCQTMCRLFKNPVTGIHDLHHPHNQKVFLRDFRISSLLTKPLLLQVLIDRKTRWSYKIFLESYSVYERNYPPCITNRVFPSSFANFLGLWFMLSFPSWLPVFPKILLLQQEFYTSTSKAEKHLL